MAVKFYRCEKCGSIVAKLNSKGCSPSCCGEPMKELEAGVTDGAREKHVPDVKVDGEVVNVQVGSVAHPMMEKHYIEFIALEEKDSVQIALLEPGQEPKASFKSAAPVAAYEYCNLHGFWKAEI